MRKHASLIPKTARKAVGQRAFSTCQTTTFNCLFDIWSVFWEGCLKHRSCIYSNV
jgi:hypothetical protein